MPVVPEDAIRPLRQSFTLDRRIDDEGPEALREASPANHDRATAKRHHQPLVEVERDVSGLELFDPPFELARHVLLCALRMRIYTIGHSTRPLDELIGLLRDHGVKRLADIRRFPGS